MYRTLQLTVIENGYILTIGSVQFVFEELDRLFNWIRNNFTNINDGKIFLSKCYSRGGPVDGLTPYKTYTSTGIASNNGNALIGNSLNNGAPTPINPYYTNNSTPNITSITTTSVDPNSPLQGYGIPEVSTSIQETDFTDLCMGVTENGYIINTLGRQYVFNTIDMLIDWLKENLSMKGEYKTLMNNI